MQSLIHGLLFSLLFIHQSIASHPPSPCPDVFSYEGSEPENNRWYGEISLRTDESLVGIRLDIELDRRADLMVSWMGEISSNDNMKFTILNLNQKLKPGPPVLSRIMTKFNRTTGSPKLRFIRLNGRKICPDETSHSEFEEPPRPSRRPDPEFEENGGDSLNEFPIGNTGNNNNRPYTQPNNNNDNNNYNNNNNNNNWPNTDSNVNNNRPVYKPPVMTTEEPYTTKKPIKTTTTTRSPYENNNNNNNKPNNNNNNNNSNRPNNNHNTVTLQASSANSNGEINGVINELLQNEKNGNKTVIITVIENNQHNRPNPVNSDNNRPVSGENSGQSKPNSNRPTERPDNHGDNSYNSNVNVVTNSGTCGEVKLAIPLVTSGQSTHRGQWPWHVALYMTEGINLSYNCGGSLVSKNKVITAAHCVTNKRTDAIVNSSKIIVYLGKHHQLQYSDEYVQTKQVIRINVFPTYNSSNYLGDLAVLTLSSDVELTKYVNPVCLWEDSNELSDLVGKEGTVVGWGFNENDSPTEELKMAKMPVVSHEVCLRSYPQFYAEFTSDKTYCAGFRNGTSVCNGDSGGGMVFNKNSKWYLRGVVSLAVAKEGLRVCDTKRFVVFTDVAKYLDFVRKNIQR